MFAALQRLQPPSSVDLALSCTFTGPFVSNLLLARNNILEIYVVHDASARVPLQLVRTYPLHGKIRSMGKLRLSTSPTDYVILGFEDAKMSVLEWDRSQFDLAVVSLHLLEDEELRDGRANFTYKGYVVAEPDNRCVVMLNFDTKLAVFAARTERMALFFEDFYAGGTQGGGNVVDFPLRPHQTIDLTKQFGIQNIKDLKFLSGYLDPTLLILHEPVPTWSGRIAVRRDTCVLTAISLKLDEKVRGVLVWSRINIPHDSHTILPLPSPYGGAVVLGVNRILYLSSQNVVFGVGLNDYALDDWSTSIQLVKIGAGVDLFDAQATVLMESPSSALIVGRYGHVHILRVRFEGRTVRSMALESLGGHLAPCNVVETIPEREMVFVGSRTADSVLLKVERLGRNALAGLSSSTISKRVKLTAREIREGYAEDLDLFTMRPTAPGLLPQTDDALALTIVDILGNLGPIADMVPFQSPASTASQAIMACRASGPGQTGGLTAMYRAVLPELACSYSHSPAPPSHLLAAAAAGGGGSSSSSNSNRISVSDCRLWTVGKSFVILSFLSTTAVPGRDRRRSHRHRAVKVFSLEAPSAAVAVGVPTAGRPGELPSDRGSVEDGALSGFGVSSSAVSTGVGGRDEDVMLGAPVPRLHEIPSRFYTELLAASSAPAATTASSVSSSSAASADGTGQQQTWRQALTSPATVVLISEIATSSTSYIVLVTESEIRLFSHGGSSGVLSGGVGDDPAGSGSDQLMFSTSLRCVQTVSLSAAAAHVTTAAHGALPVRAYRAEACRKYLVVLTHLGSLLVFGLASVHDVQAATAGAAAVPPTSAPEILQLCSSVDTTAGGNPSRVSAFSLFRFTRKALRSIDPMVHASAGQGDKALLLQQQAAGRKRKTARELIEEELFGCMLDSMRDVEMIDEGTENAVPSPDAEGGLTSGRVKTESVPPTLHATDANSGESRAPPRGSQRVDVVAVVAHVDLSLSVIRLSDGTTLWRCPRIDVGRAVLASSAMSEFPAGPASSGSEDGQQQLFVESVLMEVLSSDDEGQLRQRSLGDGVGLGAEDYGDVDEDGEAGGDVASGTRHRAGIGGGIAGAAGQVDEASMGLFLSLSNGSLLLYTSFCYFDPSLSLSDVRDRANVLSGLRFARVQLETTCSDMVSNRLQRQGPASAADVSAGAGVAGSRDGSDRLQQTGLENRFLNLQDTHSIFDPRPTTALDSDAEDRGGVDGGSRSGGDLQSRGFVSMNGVKGYGSGVVMYVGGPRPLWFFPSRRGGCFHVHRHATAFAGSEGIRWSPHSMKVIGEYVASCTAADVSSDDGVGAGASMAGGLATDHARGAMLLDGQPRGLSSVELRIFKLRDRVRYTHGQPGSWPLQVFRVKDGIPTKILYHARTHCFITSVAVPLPRFRNAEELHVHQESAGGGGVGGTINPFAPIVPVTPGPGAADEQQQQQSRQPILSELWDYRYEIRLYQMSVSSPLSSPLHAETVAPWRLLDTRQVPLMHQVLSAQTVHVAQQREDGVLDPNVQVEVIAVGTSNLDGEDIVCRGKMLLYRVVESGALLDSAHSGADSEFLLQPLLDEDISHGAVSQIQSIDGLLFASTGRKCYLYEYNWLTQRLLIDAFFDLDYYSASVKKMKNYFLVGDAVRGAMLMRWKSRNRVFEALGHDPLSEMSVTSVEFLVDEARMYLLACDEDLNLHLMQHRVDSGGPEGDRGKKLATVAACHVGSRVNCSLRFGKVVAPRGSGAAGSGGSGGARNSVGALLACNDGSIHLLSTIPSASAVGSGASGGVSQGPVTGAHERLGALQVAMYTGIRHACGLHPRDYRLLKGSCPNFLARARQTKRLVLDMDLLKRFLELDVEQQRGLVRRMGTSEDMVVDHLLDWDLSGPCLP